MTGDTELTPDIIYTPMDTRLDKREPDNNYGTASTNIMIAELKTTIIDGINKKLNLTIRKVVS